MVKVKICGIKSLQEAQMAADAGADAIGFIFANSKRKINPELAREISIQLPPFISKVGVFVNEERHVIQEISSFCNLDVLQFHGEESPDFCKRFSQKTIKALRIKDEGSFKQVREYESVSAILLDTYSDTEYGGTGKSFNWDLIKEAQIKKPIILAGGLSEENVIAAFTQVMPYGVDVSSGVEIDGIKSKDKVERFIKTVRGSV